MGLDINVSVSRSVKRFSVDWDEIDPTRNLPEALKTVETCLLNSSGQEGKRVSIESSMAGIFEVTEKIGMNNWRKCNFIIPFLEGFIRGEVVNCKDYEMDASFFVRLVSLANKVLADHSKAEDLLPTQEGFYYGSTDYDESYFSDLEMVLRDALKIKDILEKDDTAYCTIHCWW